MLARKKPFPGVQILGSSAKQKGRRKMKTRQGRERGERERESGAGGGGGERGFYRRSPKCR